MQEVATIGLAYGRISCTVPKIFSELAGVGISKLGTVRKTGGR